MLVLTRKLQEQIRIGDNITITILRVKGNTVRVGIDAPREVRVLRGELSKQEAETSRTSTVDRSKRQPEPKQPESDQGEVPQRSRRQKTPGTSGGMRPTTRLETLARLVMQAV